MAKLVPLILCGGSGSRLWPMSRAKSPKQFHPVGGPGSPTFLQATVNRHRHPGFADPICVTSSDFDTDVAGQLRDIGASGTILSEPIARNTGPAVLAAALYALRSDPDTQLVVLPSDHMIDGDINVSLLAARAVAEDGKIVTFGIEPSHPETGYGYIVDGGPTGRHTGLNRVAEFVEKPPLDTARRLIESGKALWASGISLFSALTIVEEFERFDPRTLQAMRLAVQNAEDGPVGPVLSAAAMQHAQSASTEETIFQQSNRTVLGRLDVDWSDVGSWPAIYDIAQPDMEGNVLIGDVIATETRGSMVRAEDRLVAVVGLSDVVVVDTPDALLVTTRGEAQKVKSIVERLKGSRRPEAVAHVDYKESWGESRTVLNSDGYSVRLLRLRPNATVNLDGQPGETTLHIIGGEFGLKKDVSEFDLAAGARISIPSNRACNLTNRSAGVSEALMIVGSAVNAPSAVDPLYA
ncbi:MAG: sugar phosphate nucleotidyltransferase [Pseudomonadota bacterium]